MHKFILKMKEMTAQSDLDLCPSCRHTDQITDSGGVRRFCSYIGGHAETIPIHGRVTDCTRYDPKHLPSLGMMEQIAWDLAPRRNGKMGFVVTTPEQRKRRGDGPPTHTPDWRDE